MEFKITVSEVKEIFKEIQEQPEQIFEMMRLDIKELAGRYLFRRFRIHFPLTKVSRT